MAPEVLLEKPYNYLADFWSLGCIIYETMAGGPLFDTKSLIQLIKLHQDDNIKWPSFLSNDCLFFLQGLLKNVPSNRLTWDTLLEHPFVRGHIYIVNGPTPSAPFTHPLSQSQCIARKRQINHLSQLKHRIPATELLTTSQDSINAILQSDIENLETDNEDAMHFKVPNKQKQLVPLNNGPIPQAGYAFSDLCFVSGNSNLIVTNLNDNFQMQQMSNIRMSQSRNKDLEKRKLNQNLENFSVRLGGAKGRTPSGQRSMTGVDLVQSVDKKPILTKESKDVVVKDAQLCLDSS